MNENRPIGFVQCVLISLRRLGVERIDLWQLHRIDPKVPRDEQFDVIKQMQQEGLIRHLGLSKVNIEEIQEAQKFFEVATVQNMYNLVTRHSEDVLEYCTHATIGFIPWFPLASRSLAQPGSLLGEIARKYNATPSGVALAWILMGITRFERSGRYFRRYHGKIVSTYVLTKKSMLVPMIRP